MTFVPTKGLLRSASVWGNLITLIPAIGAVAEQLEILPRGSVDQAIAVATSAAGSLLGIWGRIRASSKISGLF